jgi:hypothetical protein
LFRIVVTRALLLALPFAVFFLWRAVAIRSGREMGTTPWGWLAGAGAVLMGLSLMATAVLRPDNRGDRYVPAEAHPGGQVTPGGFDPVRPPPPVGTPSPGASRG